MKKVLFMLCVLTLLVGCSSQAESNVDSMVVVSEAVTEAETATEAVTTKKAVTTATEKRTEPVTEAHTAEPDFPAVTELRLAEPDSDDALNKRKTIFFTDDGYCYYAEIGGRDSANYVLSYDRGDGNYTPIENGEDCEWGFTDGNTIYGVKHYTRNANSLMSTICKCKDGVITPIAEIGYLSKFYFTDKYIYYCDDERTIRRMDYNGENIEEITELSSVKQFAVHDGKIWYEKTVKENWQSFSVSKIMAYDIETKENTEIMETRYSSDFRFNGDYMYFIGDGLRLLRLNTEDYSIELVCENVLSFDFCGEYIIYSVYERELDSNSKLYRLGNDENIEIFDAHDLLVQEYYYELNTIHCDDGRIFIDISSGPFYSYVAELDINGNLIKKYYETPTW